MAKYAEGTTVDADRSRVDIETTLRKQRAKRFISAWDVDGLVAIIQFELSGRRMKFSIPLPDPQAKEFVETPTGQWLRTENQAREAYEKEVRRRWRALLLTIKAKLESVAS